VRGFYLREKERVRARVRLLERESESMSETAAFSRCSGLFLDVCMC
jgi:hypothetical protein